MRRMRAEEDPRETNAGRRLAVGSEVGRRRFGSGSWYLEGWRSRLLGMGDACVKVWMRVVLGRSR